MEIATKLRNSKVYLQTENELFECFIDGTRKRLAFKDYSLDLSLQTEDLVVITDDQINQLLRSIDNRELDSLFTRRMVDIYYLYGLISMEEYLYYCRSRSAAFLEEKHCYF